MTLLKILCLLMVIALPSAQAAESRFFREINDIPLMAGLYELPEETVVFDKAEGRIIETAAASDTKNSNEIKGFYDATLPQLGWVRQTPDSYIRDGETLTLRLETRGNVQVLRLNLAPAR